MYSYPLVQITTDLVFLFNPICQRRLHNTITGLATPSNHCGSRSSYKFNSNNHLYRRETLRKAGRMKKKADREANEKKITRQMQPL